MQYLDFKPYISQRDFDQITKENNADDNSVILDTVELTAKQVVKDALFPNYNTTTIFNNIENYKQVKRWLICLQLYYLYERVPDRLVPERVIKNYDDTLDNLDKISDGKLSIDLPINKKANQVDNTSKFRWGSVPKRSH